MQESVTKCISFIFESEKLSVPNVEYGPQTALHFLVKLLHNHILVLHRKVDWFLSHYLYTIIPTDIAPSPKKEPSSKHLLGEAPLVLNHGFFAPVLPANPSWEIPPAGTPPPLCPSPWES